MSAPPRSAGAAPSIVIVGASLTGFVAGLALSARGHEVTFVDPAARPGGLLGSTTNAAGQSFDFGAHFLRETGDAELDAEVFPDELRERMFVYDYLHAGCHFCGRLQPASAFVDTRALPAAEYQRGVVDLFECWPSESTRYDHLQAQLSATFGLGFTRSVFRPALKKLFGCEMEQLAPDAHELFGLSRLVALSPEATRALKALPSLDKRLAFHSNAEGISSRKSLYPRRGGVGQWIEFLQRRLEARGARFALGQPIERVELDARRATGVVLRGGQRIAATHVLWALPAGLYLRAAAIESGSAPKMRKVTLVHLSYAQPFATDLFYFSSYDPTTPLFRCTLYSNVQRPTPGERHRMTVELLTDGSETLADPVNLCHAELVRIGALSDARAPEWSEVVEIPLGFPVLTPEYAQASAGQLEKARASADNVEFIGRTAGAGFFMHEVMLHAHRTAAQLADRLKG
jgi:protoporphyrinogen oxidase